MTNKTIKNCFTLALLASVATTPAFSQAKNFAGPSIAIGGGYSSQTATLKITEEGGDPFDNSIGQNNFSALVDLSYGLEVDKSFILSVGATYDLTDSDLDDVLIENFKTKLQDHYSLYLQPTFLVNNNTGIFGKLSYNFAKYTGTVIDDGRSASNNLEGWGYGIGSKTLLDKNTYLQVEVNYTDYDAIAGTLSSGNTYSADPKTIAGTVSIGYKF
jgi:hypothetical protein